MKNKVGRPTKYKPEIITKTKEYIKHAIPENMDIPSVEGLSVYLDIGLRTLYTWGKKYEDFGTLLKAIKTKQKLCLMQIGIFGGKEINATIVALMLRVNHKMVETTKQDITSKGEKVLVMPSELVNKYDISQNSEDSSK